MRKKTFCIFCFLTLLTRHSFKSKIGVEFCYSGKSLVFQDLKMHRQENLIEMLFFSRLEKTLLQAYKTSAKKFSD